MAKYPDASTGTASISESFELDDTSSGRDDFASETDILLELKKTLNDSNLPPKHKPPAPRRVPHPRPDVKKVDLRKTVRSPIAMAQHLSRARLNDSSETIDGGPSVSPPLLNSGPRPLRFKQVMVQKLQSTVKKFENSDEVREVVFKEWLAKKEVKKLHSRQSLNEKEKTEADSRREREFELSRRSEAAVKKWTASKQVQLQSRRKQESEEAKRQVEEAQERSLKCQEGREAAVKWREEKGRRLSQIQREKKKKKEEEEKEKKEEKEEKKIANQQAFWSWKQHKDGLLRDKVRKKKEVDEQLSSSHKEQFSKRQTEAKKSFEAWKSKKDEKIRTTKMLYTYNQKQSVSDTPWCPARGIQYSYPKSKETSQTRHKTKAETKDTSDSGASVESYSMSSFESEVEADSEGSNTSLVMESVSRTASPSKGTRKTVQVCCQTLQYWCTCEH